MKLGLEGKIAIITGAAGGIGSAVARAFAEEGVNLALLDSNASGLHEIFFDVQTSVKVSKSTVDLTQIADVQRSIEEVLMPFDGHVDILVNCAGVCPGFTPEYLLTTEALTTWRELYEVNFSSSLYAICNVWWRMRKQGGGVILNTASDLARQPVVEMLPYSVAKASIVHLTQGLATYLGRFGIRIVAVAPGPTRTAIWTREKGLIDFYATHYGLPPEDALVQELIKRGMAIPRLMDPTEVASFIVYLASDCAKSMTRTVVDLNGGSHHGY